MRNFVVEASGQFIGLVVLDGREANRPGHVQAEGGELEVSHTFLPQS